MTDRVAGAVDLTVPHQTLTSSLQLFLIFDIVPEGPEAADSRFHLCSTIARPERPLFQTFN